MSHDALTDKERFLGIIDSTITGARKDHTAVFSAELNMLKFMYELNTDEVVRERIIRNARSLYRNWMFTLARIEEYRAIASPDNQDGERAE